MVSGFGFSPYFNVLKTSKDGSGPQSVTLCGALPWALLHIPGGTLLSPQACLSSHTHTPAHPSPTTRFSTPGLFPSSLRLHFPARPHPSSAWHPPFLGSFSSGPSVPAPALSLTLTHTPEPRREASWAGLPRKDTPLPKPASQPQTPSPCLPALNPNISLGSTSSQSSWGVNAGAESGTPVKMGSVRTEVSGQSQGSMCGPQNQATCC